MRYRTSLFSGSGFVGSDVVTIKGLYDSEVVDSGGLYFTLVDTSVMFVMTKISAP